MGHNDFKLLELPDDKVVIECQVCTWKSDPIIDIFVESVKNRHSLANNWWPWTEHGKPEVTENGVTKVLTDWPIGKEDS